MSTYKKLLKKIRGLAKHHREMFEKLEDFLEDYGQYAAEHLGYGDLGKRIRKWVEEVDLLLTDKAARRKWVEDKALEFLEAIDIKTISHGIIGLLIDLAVQVLPRQVDKYLPEHKDGPQP